MSGHPVRTALALLLALIPTLAACGEPEPTDDLATAPAPPRSEAAADASLHLVVDGEGIRLVRPATGSTRPVPFGSSEEILIAALASAGFDRPEEEGEQAECGSGPRHFRAYGGFSVATWNGEFIAWSLSRSEARNITTMSGIGIGSTRSAMADAYTLTVAETTLGTEFQAGGLQGVLTGPWPADSVTAMWSGASCVFR